MYLVHSVLSIMTFCVMTLIILASSVTILSIKAFSVMTLIIMTFSGYTAEWHLVE